MTPQFLISVSLPTLFPLLRKHSNLHFQQKSITSSRPLKCQWQNLSWFTYLLRIPPTFESKALFLCLLSGLRTILKAEDLSRWSESPLKFHAQFEGTCIRAFSEESLWLSSETQRIHDPPLPLKGLEPVLEKTSGNKRGNEKAGGKVDKEEERRCQLSLAITSASYHRGVLPSTSGAPTLSCQVKTSRKGQGLIYPSWYIIKDSSLRLPKFTKHLTEKNLNKHFGQAETS